ncbi:MAG TPA: toll/interleukin-1 receptor domain-containing protein [Blastocatellia bacterium]|nr:toll/interleukin-1 receptor domain-containing protein [Blastocatellia bacterium]
MAPEYPPRLVVLTLEAAGDSIVALIENVEPLGAATLRVRWSEVEPPRGYQPVGSGALYVEQSGQVVFDGPRPVQLDDLGDRRYRWIQGTPPNIPFVMIAVVLPAGYSLRRPRPVPAAAKIHDGRLAVYWCLPGDQLGRAQVEWDVRPLDRSIEEEVRLLNSRTSLDEVPSAAGIDIDTPVVAATPPSINVFLCHSSQDKPQVRRLYTQLQRDGFVPWLDEEDILPGEAWERAIPAAVRASHVVLVCLSNGSISKEGYVQREIGFALQVAEEKPEGTIFIIPLRLEDCPLPERLAKWQRVDYFAEGGHERLLKGLRKRASQLQPG